jgi:hypothetical protein
MIQLARAAKSDRMIVAGSNSSEILLELHRRGYARVTTTKTCRIPRGQHDVALVPWREHSIRALATTLDWLVHFLSAAGVLVVWVGSHERMPNRTLRRAKDWALASSPAPVARTLWPFPPAGLSQSRPPKSREAMTMAFFGRHVSKLSGYAPAIPTPFDDNGDSRPCRIRVLLRSTNPGGCHRTGRGAGCTSPVPTQFTADSGHMAA